MSASGPYVLVDDATFWIGMHAVIPLFGCFDIKVMREYTQFSDLAVMLMLVLTDNKTVLPSKAVHKL